MLPPLAGILAAPDGQPDMLVEGALDLLCALLRPSGPQVGHIVRSDVPFTHTVYVYIRCRMQMCNDDAYMLMLTESNVVFVCCRMRRACMLRHRAPCCSCWQPPTTAASCRAAASIGGEHLPALEFIQNGVVHNMEPLCVHSVA